MKDTRIILRRAEARDGQAVLSLIDALADYEHLDRPDLDARQRLLQDAFGDRRRIDIFLAEYEGHLAGYAIILETYSSFLALPTLYLEDIFVLPEYRSQKIGYHLFKFCAQESLERGCGRMEWMVLDWNQLAIGFYERLGAKRLKAWLPYRMVRTEIEAMIQKSS